LFFYTPILSQNQTIKKLHVESKNNGTVVLLDSNKKLNLENVTAWYSSEWFYITIYDAQSDSLAISNYKNDSLKNIEISNAEESTQIALQLKENIESFEIDSPQRKSIQFLLRNNQIISKNKISKDSTVSTVSINDDIDQIKKPDNRKNKLEFNSKFIVLIGFLISGSDIANNTTFLLGSILAIIANLI
jgi:hypothetical protein|tara:strand:- start:19451 stop:20017 length:567 start_codon:yes stop_codon:yes gene_type:complete